MINDDRLESVLLSVYNKNVDMNQEDIVLLKDYANSDYIEAQVAYGIYMWNTQDKNNWKIAIDYFTKAALKNHAFAQYWLGNAYFLGTKIDKDYELGMYWLDKAMKQGVVMAKYHIAICMFFGFGCKINKEIALEYINECAKENVIEAELFLAEENKASNVYNVLVEEINNKWNSRVSSNERLALLFAQSYYNGYGFRKNYNEAYNIVNLPILKDNPDAIYIKAMCLENGWGVQKNEILAKQLYFSIKNENNKARNKYMNFVKIN